MKKAHFHAIKHCWLFEFWLFVLYALSENRCSYGNYILDCRLFCVFQLLFFPISQRDKLTAQQIIFYSIKNVLSFFVLFLCRWADLDRFGLLFAISLIIRIKISAYCPRLRTPNSRTRFLFNAHIMDPVIKFNCIIYIAVYSSIKIIRVPVSVFFLCCSSYALV